MCAPPFLSRAPLPFKNTGYDQIGFASFYLGDEAELPAQRSDIVVPPAAVGVPVDWKLDASVEKLKGGENELTITVTEIDRDGAETPVTVTVRIENNAAGTYEVGPYQVYVDTKGNTQVREIRFAD